MDDVGSIIWATNDWVDDGIVAGVVGSDGGLDEQRFIVQAVNNLWDTLLKLSLTRARYCKGGNCRTVGSARRSPEWLSM